MKEYLLQKIKENSHKNLDTVDIVGLVEGLRADKCLDLLNELVEDGKVLKTQYINYKYEAL